MKNVYFCPTPIGNLEDITIRTLNVLRKVDIIACEDTRNSGILLKEYDIKKDLISYHKFNYKKKIPEILKLIDKDKKIAVITDAGMPGISDPGTELIRVCIEKDISFTVLPGPSASILGLVMSGLDTEIFTFIGFLNSKSNKRKKELEEYKNYKETLIFYEAPHRIVDFLKDLYNIFGNRKVAICRELTKYYEEVIRDELENIIKNLDNITIKGEFVVVVEGKTDEKIEVDVYEELEKLIELGNSKSDAVKILSEKYNLNKNDVYKKSLEL